MTEAAHMPQPAHRTRLREPRLPPRTGVVVMQTAYGDRLRKRIGSSITELFDAITGALQRGGNGGIIPTSALKRAQGLLLFWAASHPRDCRLDRAQPLGRGTVIMAGSGMSSGGRLRHHLRDKLWRREAV